MARAASSSLGRGSLIVDLGNGGCCPSHLGHFWRQSPLKGNNSFPISNNHCATVGALPAVELLKYQVNRCYGSHQVARNMQVLPYNSKRLNKFSTFSEWYARATFAVPCRATTGVAQTRRMAQDLPSYSVCKRPPLRAPEHCITRQLLQTMVTICLCLVFLCSSG